MDVDSVYPAQIADPYEQVLGIDTVPSGAGGTVRLVVTGELDRVTAPQLSRAVEDVLAGPVPVVGELDVAGVGFLDSSGIRCLLHCHRVAGAAGCALLLVECPPPVVEVLRCTGLLAHFGLPERSTGRPAVLRPSQALHSLF